MRYINSVDKFGVFYQEYRQKLFYYLLRMTGDYQLSCDIMQESFARMLKHYGPETRSASLLFTIARNAMLDHDRKNGRIARLEIDKRDPTEDSEKLLMVRQEYRRVMAAMQRLEKAEREVLALVADNGFSYSEIALITGMTAGNVRVKVHRARMKLKRLLRKGNEP